MTAVEMQTIMALLPPAGFSVVGWKTSDELWSGVS
jgi:hypothetical protein